MTVRRGTYALLMVLGSGSVIEVGALGPVRFPAGSYCYVGSAMGGLDQRVSRHLSGAKRVRWHVDRLTMAADSVEAFESYPDPIGECELARIAAESGMEPFAKGFGCSDCRCGTHLFRTTEGSWERFLSASSCRRFVPFGYAEERGVRPRDMRGILWPPSRALSPSVPMRRGRTDSQTF